MRRGTILTLAASAGCGVLALVLARGMVDDAVSSKYKQSRSDTAFIQRPALQTLNLLVAVQPIHAGQPLVQQNVKFVKYPKSSLPEGYFESYEALFGAGTNSPVALVDLAENEPILVSKINTDGKSIGLSSAIADDNRAVSIRINDASGVAGFVLPGNKVDVVLIQETKKPGPKPVSKSSKGGGEPVASLNAVLLVQDVKVLAIDQIRESGDADAILAKTVTLEVNQEQAQKLILARAAGQLSLALRGRDAVSSFSPKTLKVGDLVGGSKPSIHKRTNRSAIARSTTTPRNSNPANSASVTVIRNGGQRDEVRVFREDETGQSLAGGMQ